MEMHHPMSISNHPKHIFIATFVVTLFLKLFLSVQFPVTGDEAFFINGGSIPPGVLQTIRQ
jgi:hypothetical protein